MKLFIKNKVKLLLYLMVFILSLISSQVLYPQAPPNPPGEHGGSNNVPNGGGAPIGSGLFILIGMGLAYGGKKIYASWKENLEE